MAQAKKEKSAARARRPRRAAANRADWLEVLTSAQLVRPADDPEPAYLFKHTLTQEAAYESLLVRTRAGIHRRVAEAYERLEPERLDENAALLAQHYERAGDEGKTIEYATRAGDVEARVYANTEAIAHYSLAIAIVSRTGLMRERLKDLFLRRGRVYELSGRYPEALKNYQEMEALARESGDGSMELAALMARTTIHSIPTDAYDLDLAEELSKRSQELARKLGDRAAEAKILWNRLLVNSRLVYRLRVALPAGEESLRIARELGLEEQTAYSLNDLGTNYAFIGRREDADRAILEARTLWTKLGNVPMLADNWNEAAMAHLVQGRFEEAVSEGEQGLALSRTIGNEWGEAFSQMWIGPAYLELGRPDLALARMQAAISLSEHSGFAAPRIVTVADLGTLYGEFNQIRRGLDLARTAQVGINGKLMATLAWVAAHLAHLLILSGDLFEADSLLQQGLRALGEDPTTVRYRLPLRLAEGELAMARGEHEQALKVYGSLADMLPGLEFRQKLPQALLGKGRALAALGRTDAAVAAFEQALAEARAIKARWSEWQILAESAEMLREQEPERARQRRREARKRVEEIARYTPDELRETWLKAERVRRLSEE